MITRYYVNVRDDSGNNPDFVEISETDFDELRGWKGRGSAIFLPGGYSAVYAGSGEFSENDETHKYLQFHAVRYYAIVAPVPGSTLHTIEEMSDKALDIPEPEGKG